MKRLVACFLLVGLILLCGCGAEVLPPEQTDTRISTHSTQSPTPTQGESQTQPQPITGSLRSEPLKVTVWDSGRANETSGNTVWETENGLYFVWRSSLYYADKPDLSLWLPVCTKPECIHTNSACDGYVSWEVLLKDDRFYFNSNVNDTKALSNTGLYSTFIASMKPDGTDKRLEYYVSEAEEYISKGRGFSSRPYLLTDQFVYTLAVMNLEGSYDIAVYLVDEEGETALFKTTREDNTIGGLPSRVMDLYGDEGFFEYIIDEEPNMMYRIRERALYGVDLTDFPTIGAYLEGGTLRFFRTAEGYFEVNLTTGEEIKLAEAQMENSFSHIMQPNCILESTVLSATTMRDETLIYRHLVDSHTMKLFDGQQWQDVALPDEVKNAGDTEVLIPQALTSDRIIFTFRDSADKTGSKSTAIYQILLGTDNLTLQYLATIG